MTCFFALLLLSAACLAQSAPFVQEHSRGVNQNPPGVKLAIETVDGRSSFRLSDLIRFKLTFTSQETNVYTIDTAAGASAAASSTDFIIDGPGLSAPIHSQSIYPLVYVCCNSYRHYLSRSPVMISSGPLISLKRIERFPDAQTLSHLELKPGEYAVFAQTRNIMRGWPKTTHDAYHAVSDIVLTSSNVLHLTIVADAP